MTYKVTTESIIYSLVEVYEIDHLERRGIRTWLCVLRYKTNLVGEFENGCEELKHILEGWREEERNIDQREKKWDVFD